MSNGKGKGKLAVPTANEHTSLLTEAEQSPKAIRSRTMPINAREPEPAHPAGPSSRSQTFPQLPEKPRKKKSQKPNSRRSLSIVGAGFGPNSSTVLIKADKSTVDTKSYVEAPSPPSQSSGTSPPSSWWSFGGRSSAPQATAKVAPSSSIPAQTIQREIQKANSTVYTSFPSIESVGPTGGSGAE
jgi:hypothetical protein